MKNALLHNAEPLDIGQNNVERCMRNYIFSTPNKCLFIVHALLYQLSDYDKTLQGHSS